MKLATFFGALALLLIATVACGESSPPMATPNPNVSDGLLLIEQVIACDGEQHWDKSVMTQNVLNEQEGYIELLRTILADCEYAKTVTRTPSPTLTEQELLAKVCFDFGVMLRQLESMPWTAEQKADFLASEGWTQEELTALSAECSSP